LERISCDSCGGSDFYEQDGFAVCIFCRSKYDITELKKRQVGGMSAEVSSGSSVQTLLDKAEKHWKMGDKAKAKKLYAQVLEFDPSNDVARQRSK